MKNIRLTFLGTGTSTGVPQINCRCPVCLSADARDKRLRASALVEIDDRKLLIDCGPDFRAQALRQPMPYIDALLLTHQHYDHVGGIDDLRPFCHTFRGGERMPVYCSGEVSLDLHARVPYCFKRHPYPGVPTFDVRLIEAGKPFRAAHTDIVPLAVMHWKLPILGFKIGPLAYITDAKTLPEETLRALEGIDTLVLNALRIDEHVSHLSLSQALQVVEMVRPRQTFLTHISHQMGLHAQVEARLPEGVHLAHDGLTVRAG